ncbi:MAG: GNAT family N-acetyltransferase, partial [Proteobacteria bacterium]|nr:GNAT family N-acetyltransferase [Pseudomonadota bacterium]
MNAAIAPLPRLRALHARDLPALMAIETAAYEFPWTAGIFRDCLSAGYECWVLEDGSELLGYGVLSAAAGEAHILNVCVAPAQQRRGLGRMLVRRLL